MSKYNPKIHHRRSIRLKGYEYSQTGAYFVTLVTHQRKMLFGEVVSGEMRLNALGEIAEKWWYDIPIHFPNVKTGAFVVMPNHIHGIIIIETECRGAVPASGNDVKHIIENQGEMTSENQGEMTSPLRKPTLGQIVAYYKYQSTKEMNLLDGSGVITKFWQRNYHDRIIRDECEMERIWRYIESNPDNWKDDREFSDQ